MVDPVWVIALMTDAQPTAPWRDTYEATAQAIARAASARPLPFPGDDRAERTAALLVSVAWFEGTFKPDAQGDRVRGRPTSFCTMQVSASNFAALEVTAEQLLGDVDACVSAGLTMMHFSFGVCRGEPLERRLDHYAVGGATCARPRRDEGGHRVRKALALFRKRPPPPR